MPSEVWGEITCPFPNFSGTTVEVWEWMSIFTPHFIMYVITYPCWDKSKPFLVKGVPGVPVMSNDVILHVEYANS